VLYLPGRHLQSARGITRDISRKGTTVAQDTTLRKLFVDELRDAYHAEKQLIAALPKMAKAATADDLRSAIEDHLKETEEHVHRLEQAFDLVGEPVKAKVCAGMAGIIEEGSDVIREEDKGAALDAAIIASGQRAEHYEMAAYGTLVAWAKALGHDDVATLLEATLEEEIAADQQLTELAEGGINTEAVGEEGPVGEEGSEEGDAEETEPATSASGKSTQSKGSKGKTVTSKTASRR
jgi:ferritin-like metal-binding protein YciE